MVLQVVFVGDSAGGTSISRYEKSVPPKKSEQLSPIKSDAKIAWQIESRCACEFGDGFACVERELPRTRGNT